MSIGHRFTCDQKAEQVSCLAKDILQDAYLVMQVISIKFSENYETNLANLDAKLVEVSQAKPKKRLIHGEGVGLMDACFDALIKCYDNEFCSLDTISIIDFVIHAHVGHDITRRSDSNLTALLRVKNSQDQEYSFECTSSSISHSTVAVVQESIAFFINAELAYKRLHFALLDAEERGRHDLVSRFRNQMSTLVHATSYERLVELLRGR